MLEHFFRRHERIQALREGSHSPLLEGFAEELRRTGYTKWSARARIRAAEHLLHWTARERIAISDVTEDLLKRFRQHVERCRCPGFGPVRLDSVRGDRLFVDYLRSTGSLTASVEPHQNPPLLVAFRQWMRQERGTCDRTLHNYDFYIQALLRRLGDDPGRFDAQNLRQFVLETNRQSGSAVAKKCTTALRMFLRFLIAEGQCAANLCALTVLQATNDLRKVSLWLGHASMQTTEIYTRADPKVKLEALESIIAPKLRSGRFKATDELIASLQACNFTRGKKTT